MVGNKGNVCRSCRVDVSSPLQSDTLLVTAIDAALRRAQAGAVPVAEDPPGMTDVEEEQRSAHDTT